ncbi:hypothetical protein IGI04_036950 [Brassica rapa subsp. trilocularis]|uniref:Zinc finger GRF-type domain-containing protein n=1 Tax=Brassica rapa subsp. trilocularis TaxID=1813537 RepID=A0ABQ7LIL6_BRACM|nr:hypothetical protein IGI04_036950 [Brassica rapa subsp. trilocularis]
MGQDYSYTQPSSSAESLDMTYLLEAECELYKDEDDSRILHQVYGDEADDGMPSTCYCGSDAVVATSYTRKDPGRLYLTCENVNDGDCHIWKWWDVAVTEELRDVQTQLRLVKEQAFECDQKLMKLQKVVCELSKKNAVLRNGFALRVCVMVAALLLVGLAEELPIIKLEPLPCLLKVAYLRLCVAVRATQNILKTMDPKTSYTSLLFSQSQTTVDLDSPEPFWLGSQEKLSKQKVLERNLGKKEPLTEMETSLQLKLMAEMFSSSQVQQ